MWRWFPGCVHVQRGFRTAKQAARTAGAQPSRRKARYLPSKSVRVRKSGAGGAFRHALYTASVSGIQRRRNGGIMFAQRLRELRKRDGVSQAAVAEMLGISQQAVGKWEKGRATPEPQTLARIAHFFSVSTDYLIGCSDGMMGHPGGSGHRIPIIGTVRAGYGALAYEDDYGEEYADVKNPSDYFYLLVRGDSMEPRISDGDLALVHRQSTLESGELGVIVYGEDGEGTLKKFIIRGNTVILQPFNPAYSPQIIAGEELDRMYIAGKVVETRARW